MGLHGQPRAVAEYPAEALDQMDESGSCAVLATGTPAELESFLEDYRQRHQAACQEWSAWDDGLREWDPEFDAKCDELCRRHAVSTIVADVKFEIVEIGVPFCSQFDHPGRWYGYH